MEARTREEPDAIIIEISGDVGHEEVEAFRDLLLGTYQPKGKQIILEASKLNYLNSAGVGVIAALQKAMHAHGQTLILRNPSPGIDRLLRVTRLDTVVTIDRGDE